MNFSKYMALMLFAHISSAEIILSEVPKDVDLSKQYVIYLHGAIIERGNLKPIHPSFGLYDFPAVQKGLATKDIILISEQRKPKTVAVKYAKKVQSQVNALITKGVKSENITIVGFSKGASITIIASDIIKNAKLNYVIMATCGAWHEKSGQLSKLRLTGHVLSLYELSDSPGYCERLAKKSKDIQSFKEVVTNTGKAHGTFFQPSDVWLTPVLSWINRQK